MKTTQLYDFEGTTLINDDPYQTIIAHYNNGEALDIHLVNVSEDSMDVFGQDAMAFYYQGMSGSYELLVHEDGSWKLARD
jgi:PhoPQ-activated pathogenicity-related protein